MLQNRTSELHSFFDPNVNVLLHGGNGNRFSIVYGYYFKKSFVSRQMFLSNYGPVLFRVHTNCCPGLSSHIYEFRLTIFMGTY